MKTFIKYLESKDHSKASINVHYRGVGYYLDWCETENIEAERGTYTEVLSYIQSVQKRDVKQRTIQIYLNSLSHYFDWQISLGKRLENPTKTIEVHGIKRKLLYHILSKQELENLYHNYTTKDESIAKRNKAIIGCMIWQGLDSTALKNIQTTDLKLREGKIFIQNTRKSNSRTLALEASQIMDLMEYQLQARNEILQQSGKETIQLFVSTGGSDRFSVLVQSIIKQLHKQNPTVTSLQQIRASVITHWLKQYNLREVQYRAGHRFVSSTEAYQINDLDDLQEDINKYHPL